MKIHKSLSDVYQSTEYDQPIYFMDVYAETNFGIEEVTIYGTFDQMYRINRWLKSPTLEPFELEEEDLAEVER